ncbi:MAG: hypothetical protein K0R89_1965 [Ramlibacter sp.]|jgi:hypothetical protein|nr:hypothetical protein [Ramlibacter sp.]
MSRWLVARLVVWGVVLGVPATLIWRCTHQPSQDAGPRVTGAALVEEAFSVRFDPGKGPGVPMRLDWADTRTFAHDAYFAKHGYRDPPRDPPISVERLERTGFPHLQLTWPSLHMPESPLCISDAGAPHESCPTFSTPLESVTGSATQRLVPGELWQWTAFHTRRAGAVTQWAGWQCDAQRQLKMHRQIKAPDADRREWAVHPLLLQPECGSPNGFLEKRAPALAGFQEHPVLWSCTTAADANARSTEGECMASFHHAGRLVRLRLPGRAWMGDDEHNMPPLHRVRHRMVEAAWRTLEDAAAAARKDAPPPDWQMALKRELGWCEQYAARTAALRRQGRSTEAREAWSQPGWGIGTVDNRGPCSRALHRVLRALDKEPVDGKPPALLVAAARRLAEIESENSLSKPVWGLARDLIARDTGARSMAFLQWRVRQQYRGDEAAEIVAHFDALRDDVARLPAKERVALRRDMAAGWIRSDGEMAERAQDLSWEFTSDWLQSPGVLELSTQERLAVLLGPAAWSRKVAPGLPNPRMEALIPAMQAEARRIAEDKEMLGQHRLIYTATLSVHAAWHANRLAVHGPDAARWKQWLVEHAAWAETALPQAARDWVAAVSLHRDVALKGRETEPNCPGGSLLGCRGGTSRPRSP